MAVVVVAAASAGCRVELPGQGVARAAVVGGDLDPGDPAVVALVARRTRCEEQEVSLLCTGTVVSPRVVLTAAHCLDVFGEDGQYEIFLGSRLGSGDGRFALVTSALRHPAYDPVTHEHDLALLRLAVPVDVTPVPLPSGLLAPAVGQPLRVVGFGTTVVGELAIGEKRSGWMSISEATATAVSSAPAPGMSCTGDSGGPVFVTAGGSEQLLGVSASGDPGCRTYAFNVRADAAADDFIRPFLLESDSAPSGYGDTSAAATGGFCAQACAGPQDCPAGLACVAGEGGAGQCMLLSLREGAFGKACGTDAECSGGPCARLLPEGTGACRCFRSCAGAPGAFGCTAASTGGPRYLLAALTLVIASRKGRRARAGEVPQSQLTEVPRPPTEKNQAA
jgi:hypothetical protein